ncbi:30S ribosomal protein S9 [candidate division WWE3 bacterium RIFCSPLOWO2_01_FULL_53_14]|uniref:30S ribosomal protein S9 n=1 Tax=candidate division WWE3 bacterium RIFCSPLOWO2_01_FULL_53_14 TaxID=1802628 RepID=A0A1F4VQZ3_UNCKA|nr:MAG: 30S ribosomal protein S9 [candidate division WWE3 bacterium RIFCSPLOWO2_01_FULL_53_14]
MTEKKQEKFYQAIGRRKESTAAVRLFEGRKESQVNGVPASAYFPADASQSRLAEPFRATGTEGKFYFVAKSAGGGKTGQLDSVVLGIARALVSFNADLRKPLRDVELLTRDPREKERKKYFLKKARKRPQYSKR